MNYTDGYEGRGYDSRTNGGQLTLGSSSTGLGLNATEGFSLSIAVKDYSPGNTSSSAIWKSILTFTSGNSQNMYLQKDSGDASTAGAWAAYCGGNVGNWANLTISRDSFSNIIITFQNGELNIYLDHYRIVDYCSGSILPVELRRRAVTQAGVHRQYDHG